MEYVVREGDVLFSWSGSLGVDIWSGGDGALNLHLFKVTSKTYGKWFFYQWVNHHLSDFQEIAQGDEMEGDGRAPKNVDYELRQLLSDALIADGITDVFKVAGLQKQDISILSDQFLAEVSKIPQKNLAVELLQRLLRDEVQTRFKTNVVKQKRFSEMLQASLNKYANRSIEAAQVIEELIAMAKQFRDEAEKVEAMGLSIAEVAFYDALANNQSAHDLMGDEVLMKMARELATKLRGNLSIDWQYKENVRAKLRTMIKALLKRYKHLPDQEPAAIELVLQQTEMISEEWARRAGT